MSVIASALRHMLAAGMNHDAVVQAVADMEAQLSRDPVAERKRERDRDRMRQRRDEESRDVARRSATEATSPNDPPPPSFPPDPPKPPTPTRECVSSRMREAEFERFWSAYPRKEAKATARKKHEIALTKVSADVLVAAVERQRSWEQWQRGFIPHAASWLNQERWNDEEPPPQQAPRQAHERPNPHDKFARKEANLARAFSAPVRPAGQRWEP